MNVIDSDIYVCRCLQIQLLVLLKGLPHVVVIVMVITVVTLRFRLQKLQEVAFPRKDELKKRLQEKYSREHSEYLRAQVCGSLCVVQSDCTMCLIDSFIYLLSQSSHTKTAVQSELYH